ncbi:transcription termination factor Rho [Rubrobacter xylanophilus DSM 9941]|uniref:Transcription termination factor Rho n=1 Tax=Rubrobacter xylanophilus (strain DSM 9941 / JCM 11954 / NBRC 16129 / PRD-1) TaxID=266117 RepID=Q1AVG2_RUBXD|nr:transcription termination factor Rho [Rubrobacter xylanophilus]ABG04616.1 transcription termination factor Rho [Rubrobacter xylanophilus DSM 9941]
MTELATLERKRLSDLHQIASQLGIEHYRKYRKAELAELIYKVATQQAAEQQRAGENPGSAGAVAEAPAANGGEEQAAPEARTQTDAFGEADTAVVERPEEVEKRRQEQQQRQRREQPPAEQEGRERDESLVQSGVLDVLPDGFGFLRTSGYSQSKNDVYISTSQIKRFNLRRGDYIVGQIRPARNGEKYPAMVRIETINGREAQKGRWRPNFDDLTPLYPMERLRLEWKPNDIAPRVIDLVAPIGKGQRGLIVSPPKAGKTTILKQIAQSIAANYPEVRLFVLLADERPEEVTDWERSVREAEVVASTFDQPAENHIAVAELVLERVKRLVEEGEDVVVLLDSITRLARAYNLAAPASGRILSGGVDSAALYPPKKFFGAARNIENGGSLTILASALIDTGSRMDEVIYEEFKGTGNMEIHLDRKLANRRIYPAINIEDSGTRKEELLMEPAEAQRVWQVRNILNALDTAAKIELLIQKLKETRTNAEFLRQLQRVRS